MGIGSDLLPQPEGAKFTEQFRHIAVGILDVSEYPGIGRAGFHAAGQQIFAHPVVAERALFHHPLGPVGRQGRASFRVEIGRFLAAGFFNFLLG
jgi:hypothetical protein